jgi:hypothetical protein
MKQRCVLNLIKNVTNVTCIESYEAALSTELDYQLHQNNVHRVTLCSIFVQNLITKVTKLTFTESHEAALCTELDYKRHQLNVHRVA